MGLCISQCFAKCVLIKHGFVDDMGELQVKKTVDELSMGGDREKVSALVDKCKTTSSSDPCEKAFAYYSCYKKEAV